MKKSISLKGLFLVLLLSIASWTTNKCLCQQRVQTNLNTGFVYFIRQTGSKGSSVAFSVFIDNKLASKLKNNSYSIHKVIAGTHKFTVQSDGSMAKPKAEPIYIDIESGKSYYIQMIFQRGYFVNNLFCLEVTESSAKTMLSQLNNQTPDYLASNAIGKTEYSEPSLSDNKVNQAENKTIKNGELKTFSISANFIGGIGMNPSYVFEHISGEIVTINGGGGVGLNATLEYYFSKSFGLSAGIGWQRSYVDDPLYEAYGDFSRWVFQITPKLLLPINERHQFNFGAGPGLYFNGELFLYLSGQDLPSVSYSSSLGIHLLGEYKFHVNNWLSIGLGAKYSTATYKANYVSSNGSITLSNLKEEIRDFKGNGLYFFTGISINFNISE